MKQRRWPFLAALAAVLLLAGVGLYRQWWAASPPDTVLRGRTMGTTYTVRIAGALPVAERTLHSRIEARLVAVNAALSTWDAQSELSRFNAGPAAPPIAVGEDLRLVLAAALRLAAETGGAFDPTVGPLVELWGFGPSGARSTPTAAEIAALRARIGHDKVTLRDAHLSRAGADVRLDLSAIGKGYGADAVAGVLDAAGLRNYIVEIGGDLRVRGRASTGTPWRLGIQSPEAGSLPGAQLTAAVDVPAGGVATSGSYRRFRRTEQGLAHHVIDPRTGRPARHRLVSVTVLAADAMLADGIATALMVMGRAEGMAWVEQRAGVEALFLEQAGDGDFRQRASSGFPPLLAVE